MTAIRTLAAAVAFGLAVQAAHAEIKPLNSIAMEINATIITYGDLRRSVDELKSRPANQGIPEEQLVQAAKTRLVERALLADAARQQGMKVQPAAIDHELKNRAAAAQTTVDELYARAAAQGYDRAAYRLEIAKDLLIEHLLAGINAGINITNDEIGRAIQKGGSLPQGEPYTVYTVRRIILNAEDQNSMPLIGQRLTQIAQAIAHGSDFAAMARRYSQEPQAANGGVHDDITDEMLPPNVDELLHQLQINQATVPLSAGKSWQIVQLLGKRTETDPVKMQREAVRRMLLRQAQQERQTQLLEELQQNLVMREY